MGCDIHGSIEIRKHDRWQQASRLLPVVGRSYDTFGCLFGVRNSSNFTPLFAGRGFPDERSRGLDDRINHWGGEDYIGAIDFHSPTHFTHAELAEVDWDETADSPDSRISVVNENGEWQAKAAYMGGLHGTLTNEELERARAGERVEIEPKDGEKRYAVHQVMTRKQALSGAWEWVLFDYMETIADRFGSENVRMVVWFDN